MDAANGMDLLSYRELAPSVFYPILFLLSELFLLTNTIGPFSCSRSFKSIVPKLLDCEQSLIFLWDNKASEPHCAPKNCFPRENARCRG